MASAKPAANTRRSGPAKTNRTSGEPEISPARWAGVGLVIAAIVAAIFLAVISPSDPEPVQRPGTAGVEPSPTPTPAPSVLDTRVPTGQPRIVAPEAGRTDEYEIPVTINVPEEDLPRRLLTLVIIRDGEIVARKEKPTLDSRVTVPGVRLREGTENELVAALEGPGGLLGPLSRPVLVTQDPDAPSLAITSPEKGTDTYAKTITLSITSEPGAEVRIRNEANDWGPRKRVAPTDGEIEVDVRLSYGPNKIVVESEDQTGRTRRKSVNVRRKDGQPYVDVKVPKSIDKAALPRRILVQVKVVDNKGEAMEGAMVAYTLGAPGYPSEPFEERTGPDGTSKWRPLVERSSSSAEGLELGVTVTSPRGDEKVTPIEIPFS